MIKELLEKLKDFFLEKEEPVVADKNRGIIETEPLPEDYRLGGEKEAFKLSLQEDRDFTNWLPEKELQNSPFETWNCVAFSRNNCIETLMKRMYDLNVNYSDRFLGAVAGTKPHVGNTLNKVAQAGRKYGSVAESLYPFEGKNVYDYYKSVPSNILKEAEKILFKYEFEYEWIDWGGCDNKKLWEALKYGPLQVSVAAWGPYRNGIYQRTGARVNHAVMLYKGQYGKYWWIYDHYENVVKKLAWNYYFGSAMLHSLKKKSGFQLVQSYGDPKVYVVDEKQVARHIPNEKQFVIGREGGFWGDWDDIKVVHPNRFKDTYKIDGQIIFKS